MHSRYHPDSLRGFTFEEGYDLVIRTQSMWSQKLYKSWEVTMIFQRGRGDTVSYPGYTVLTRLSCPHAVLKKWHFREQWVWGRDRPTKMRHTALEKDWICCCRRINQILAKEELLASIVWYEELFSKVSLQKVVFTEHLEKRWPR